MDNLLSLLNSLDLYLHIVGNQMGRVKSGRKKINGMPSVRTL